MGENFLNFPLYPELIPYEGVDFTHIKSRPYEKVWDQGRTRVWEHWANNFMGLTDPLTYPYNF